MKIQKLTIENIASITNAVIDFSSAPLADESLFLITGDTGTGKTTILNCICLALYDCVPSFKSIGSSEADADGLQTNNPRQLMRRGSTHAEVTLTFIGNDEKRYRATWSVRRARGKISGKIQPTARSLQLLDDDVVYERKDQIETALQQCVGLSFDQFTRTTMLAQGDFATFIKASDNIKAEILEKLTKTGIYAEIGLQVNAMMKDAENAFVNLNGIITDAKLLSDEEKMAMNEQITTLSKQIPELATDIARVDKCIGWLTQWGKLNVQLQEKNTALQGAQQTVNSEEFIKKSTHLKQWDETAEVRNIIKAIDTAKANIRAYESELTELGTGKWHDILNGICALDESADKLEKKVNELQSRIDAAQASSTMYGNVQRIDQMAKDVKKELDDASEYAKLSDEASKNAQKSAAAEGELKQKSDEASGKFDAQKKEVDRLNVVSQKLNVSEISKRLQSIVEQIDGTNTTIHAIEQHDKAVVELADASAILKETDNSIASATVELNEAEKRQPIAKTECERCEAFLKGQMELADHIASLHQLFAETDTCPLCGSKHVQMLAADVINKELDEVRQKAEKARVELDNIDKKIVNTKERIKLLNISRAAQVKKVEAAKQTLADAKRELSKTTNGAAAPSIAELREGLTKLNAQKGEANTALNAANNCIQELTVARATLEKYREAKEKAVDDLQKCQQQTRDIKADAVKNSELAAKSKYNADNHIEDLRRLLTPEFANAITLENVVEKAKQISERAGRYENAKENLSKMQTALDALRQTIAHHRESISKYSQRFEAYVHQPVENKNLVADIHNFVERIGLIDGAMSSEKKNAGQNNQLLDAALQPLPYTVDDVRLIAQTPQDAVEEWRKEVNTGHEALSAAQTGRATILRLIETHKAERPEMDADATWQEMTDKKAELSEQLTIVTTEKTRIEESLKNDANTLADVAQKKQELENIRTKRDNLRILDKIFGGADGGRFRKIAQSYVLRALLSKANYYLSMLSPRYTLACSDGSLTINVVDADYGDAVRTVGSLSGGETFIVSLALALGLSSISKNKIKVDTLFIDEGFGNLDRNSLEIVLNTLDRLHRLGGRRIGIISHIQEVKSRIPTQILVTRCSPGTSKVTVTTT